jgi:hypothetical protein
MSRNKEEAKINTDPLNSKLFYIISKNSVRASKRALYFTNTKTNLLMLFKEIIAVCGDNHTEHTNKK